MTVKEAWELLQDFAYKMDVDEYAYNRSKEDGELYRQAEEIINELVESQP